MTGQLIEGTMADDALAGADETDTLRGLDGDDRLDGGAGEDLIDGGADDDVFVGLTGGDTLLGGEGTDTAYFGLTGPIPFFAYDFDPSDPAAAFRIGASAQVVGGIRWVTVEDVERFSVRGEDAGPEMFAILAGTSGADALSLATSDRVIAVGGDGDDVLSTGTGADTLEGGAGADVLRSGDGADVPEGGDGVDTLEGSGGADSLSGGEGADLLSGGDGNDRLTVGGGDIASGGNGDDAVTIEIAATDDGSILASGGEGADRLVLSGGVGMDLVVTGNADGVSVSMDDRTLVMADGFEAVRIDVDDLATRWYEPEEGGSLSVVGTVGDAFEIGRTGRLSVDDDEIDLSGVTGRQSGFDIDASYGDDAVTGSAYADELIGEAGADLLIGGGGDDVLYGDAGPLA